MKTAVHQFTLQSYYPFPVHNVMLALIIEHNNVHRDGFDEELSLSTVVWLTVHSSSFLYRIFYVSIWLSITGKAIYFLCEYSFTFKTTGISLTVCLKFCGNSCWTLEWDAGVILYF